MLISEFARAAGMSRDTVRFYVRRGLLTPLAGNKGGSNPYQVFTSEHVQMARTIRMAQSLGFSLREIAALNVEYQAKRITPSRGAEILRGQLARLEEKAAHVNAMIRYIRAKLAWLDAGSKGPEPNFTDYENKARAVRRGQRVPARKTGSRASAMLPRASRNGGGAAKALSK
jgi:MerR family transcriptional regulator, copper efflux regulator